jgi:hypothetical protein
MSTRTVGLLLALVLLPAAAGAQRRGTMELGAFASATTFDKSLTLDNAIGGGGRIGMFFVPRLSAEFEEARMKATRPLGLADVNVGIIAGRLTAVAYDANPFSFIVGVGAGVSTETNFLHEYGVDVLAGVKYAFNDRTVFRVDGVWDWLTARDWKSYKTLRVGLAYYRHP